MSDSNFKDITNYNNLKINNSVNGYSVEYHNHNDDYILINNNYSPEKQSGVLKSNLITKKSFHDEWVYTHSGNSDPVYFLKQNPGSPGMFYIPDIINISRDAVFLLYIDFLSTDTNHIYPYVKEINASRGNTMLLVFITGSIGAPQINDGYPQIFFSNINERIQSNNDYLDMFPDIRTAKLLVYPKTRYHLVRLM